MKYRNIVFDLGGVLVGLDGPRCIKAFNELGCQRVSEYVERHLTADLFLDIEVGRITTADFCQEVRSLTSCMASDESIVAAWNTLLTTISRERRERLLALRHAGHRVFLLSNTNDMHWVYTRERLFPMDGKTTADFFDRVFLSYEMQLAKPDKRIFLRMMEEGGMVPAETLFIDDNSDNVEMARSLGIHTFLNTHIDDWLHADHLFE